MADDTGMPKSHPYAGRPRRWIALHQQAKAAVARRLLDHPVLTPRQLAETVAGVLPIALRQWLFERLSERGWLAENARIPFDVLDGPGCPPEFNGPQRALVRLTVFGPPGQGLASRDRRREAVYQRLCAEIMRTAVDTSSLDAISRRVMASPEVTSDAVLMSMMRAFIAERNASLRMARSTPAEQHQAQQESSKLIRAFDDDRPQIPSRGEIHAIAARLHSEFDAGLAQFSEDRARRALDRLRELRRKYPVHVSANRLQECEERLDRFLKQAGVYRRQIEDLTRQAVDAASRGDEETAKWIDRRLFAIHTLLPTLLPLERLERLRAQISQSEARHDEEETAHELLEKQRAVAAEIKNLAGVIHRFHELTRSGKIQDAAYHRAEVAYRQAVERIRTLDTDWLAGLLLQLETFIDDLEDPAGELQSKLDHFMERVRDALNTLRREIRAIQAETQGGTPPPPKSTPPTE